MGATNAGAIVEDETCCAPRPAGPAMAEADVAALAGRLKALADPSRVTILSLVAAASGGAACVCDIQAVLGLSQPTVSHHLKVLVDAGLLTREKRGVWAYFGLVPGALDDIADAVRSLALPAEN